MSDCQGHGQYYQCKGLLLTITGWKHLTNMCGETLSMNLHKHQLYLLEQHSKSLKNGQQLFGLTLRVNPRL